MNFILGEMIIEKLIRIGAISKMIVRTGKTKFDLIVMFRYFPVVLH